MAKKDDDELVPMLLRQLAALEGSVNEISKYVTDQDELTPPPMEDIVVRKDTLRILFEQASSVLMRLEGVAGPSDRRSPLMSTVIAAQTKLCRWMQQHEAEHRSSPQRQMPDPALDMTLMQGFTRADHLPRLELPRFTGAVTEWNSFKTRFERRIATLTEDAEKFAFLLKCLEKFEPARNMCEALENSGLSFNDVWDKLEERFYKRRLAFEGHFTKAIKLKKVPKPSAKSILSIIDSIDTMTSSARKIAGEGTQSLNCVANGLLVGLAKEKLDDATLSKMEEKMDLQKIYSWTEFKAVLERHANQLACLNGGEIKSAPAKTMGVMMQSRNKPGQVGVKPNSNPMKCEICSREGHRNWTCPDFTAAHPRQRRETAKQRNLCFNCLQGGHGASSCKSAYTCRTCRGKHHTMLHEDREPSGLPQQVSAVSIPAQNSANHTY